MRKGSARTIGVDDACGIAREVSPYQGDPGTSGIVSAEFNQTWPRLTSRDEFRFLVDLVFQHGTADHTCIVLQDVNSGTSRFANNQIIQNLNLRKLSFSITSAFGRCHGSASTTDLTAGSIKETLKQSEEIARVSPDDPEFLPPVEAQTFQIGPRLAKKLVRQIQPDGWRWFESPSINVKQRVSRPLGLLPLQQ